MPNAPPSHIQDRIWFTPWRDPVKQDTMHLNGSPNKERNTTIATNNVNESFPPIQHHSYHTNLDKKVVHPS
jgi:hypothetical protein